MTLTTRRALLGGGLAAGAVVLGACDGDSSGTADPGTSTPPTPSSPPTSGSTTGPTSASPVTSTGSTSAPPTTLDPQDWASVQADFLLDPSLGQFAAFVLSPHTRTLQAAIDGYREALGRDTETALHEGIQREDAVRHAAARFAGGTADQYALTGSTTMGLATMYGGLRLRPGDEVLTTTHDFYSTQEALRLLSLRTGAHVRQVTLYDDPAGATVAEMTDRLVRAVGERTRVVAITWVHSGTGVRVPVREIADALADAPRDIGHRVLLCVDGVHGLASVDVDLPDLGCDFLAAGTHKWLFGPRGTGILYGRDWPRLTELIPTFSPASGGAGRLTAGGYHCFEHHWAMADAFDLMAQIGRARTVQRTVQMATQLKEGLAGVDGLRVVTPADPAVSAGIICVDVRGLSPQSAVDALRGQGVVASATPYTTSYLRLGPSLATRPDQVDTAVAAVRSLAHA